MDDNEIRNFIAATESKMDKLHARIKELETKSKKYQAEKDDHANRIDMAEDGKIDNVKTISKEQAKQIIQSFHENYDEQSTANIEQTRKSDPNNKQVVKYDKAKQLVDRLKEVYNL